MSKTIVGVNPWADARAMEEVFDRLFGGTNRVPSTVTLPIDITERDATLMIKASLPGIDPNDVQVQVEQNVLTIRGESKHETIENEKVYRRELAYGQFVRSLRIPEGYDLEKIDAEFKHGVLIISIPKAEEQRPRTVQVTVRS